MICNPDVLKSVPLFALLDAEESAVLAAQATRIRPVPSSLVPSSTAP